jgi:hypothetical protein
MCVIIEVAVWRSRLGKIHIKNDMEVHLSKHVPDFLGIFPFVLGIFPMIPPKKIPGDGADVKTPPLFQCHMVSNWLIM